MSDDSLWTAAWQSLLAGGGGTTLGALPIYGLRTISPRAESALSGFSAGVMLAAAFVALLIPALERASGGGASALATWPVLLAVCVGAALIAWIHRVLPHEHFGKGVEGAHAAKLARVWLFAIALGLHNLPEGLAVGVGVASGDARVSIPVTLGIAVQNVPEGLIVAIAFVSAGYSRTTALLVTLLTGLVEPVGAVVGWASGQVANEALPAALAFAAGAMLFVVSHEIIPETHREGRSMPATFGLVAGVLLMLEVDLVLG